VYPVYYVGLPAIVQRFVARFDFSPITAIYSVCTSGDDDGVDCSTHKIRRMLRKKGKALSGGFNVQMPGNYIKMYDATSQVEIAELIAKARVKASAIAKAILENAHAEKRDKLLPIALAVNGVWQSRVHSSDKKFFVDASCTGCGLCARVCPVDNIELVDGRPHWKHACEECLACLHMCPQKAINTKATVCRARYRNPEIACQEFIAGK
jgi:ferredoxin